MKYSLEDTEVKALQKEVKQCSECVQKLTINFNMMKRELDHAHQTLESIMKSIYTIMDDL